MTGQSLRRRLALLFVVGAAVTLGLAVLATSSVLRLDRRAHEQVDQVTPALLATQVLSRAYSDQSAALRGFVASGQEPLLAPYTAAQRQEQTALARLARLLGDRPILRARLADVRSRGDAWHARAAEPLIAQVRDRGPGSVTQRQLGDSEALRRQVRAALTDLQRPLDREVRASGRHLREDVNQLWVVLAAVLLGILLVGVTAWLALRWWVINPLRDLGSEVDRVEAGDLDRRVTVGSAPAEIAVLAEQIERMRLRILQEYALAERAREEALEAQATIEAQAEDLRRSNAELEQFAYVASHDLQEPLRKVASFCQLLERRYKGELDERGEQYIEFAVDGAKRMQRLINDLLAFSRVGRTASDLEEVDLGDVLAQARRQLAGLLEENDAELTHDPLPVVSGDASLLVQLLQNLIGNGVKFRGELPPRVHLSVRSADDGMVEIACSDNGIGIDPQY